MSGLFMKEGSMNIPENLYMGLKIVNPPWKKEEPVKKPAKRKSKKKVK